MKNKLPLLTVIIPAKNEEKSIAKTLLKLEKQIKIPHEIIVINDHSKDRTKSEVLKFSKNNSNIQIIDNKKNITGFASSIKTGLNNVKSGVFVPVMADDCDDPRSINVMYQKINKGWDVVCGSRYIKGGKKIGGPKTQSFFSKLVCRSLFIVTGIPTTDVSNSFKMYRKDFIKKILFSKKSGVEVSIEIIFKAYFNKARITEVPTIWRGRVEGLSKFKMIERIPKYLKLYIWAIVVSIIYRTKLIIKFT